MFSRSNSNENILVAPINVFKTLSTVMLGAAGETEKELFKMLSEVILKRKTPEGSNRRVEEFHREMGKLLAKVTDIDPGVKFGSNINIAGGIFVQKGFEIKPKFTELAKSIYRSDVTELDFERDGLNSAIAVNKYVEVKIIILFIVRDVTRQMNVYVAYAQIEDIANVILLVSRVFSF